MNKPAHPEAAALPVAVPVPASASDGATVRGLAALGQPLRWRAYQCVLNAGPGGITAGALAQQLALAPSALSFHLKELSTAGLLESEHQGRFVIYRTALPALNALVGTLAGALVGALDTAQAMQQVQPSSLTFLNELTEAAMTQSNPMLPVHEPIHVLFLCNRNSARSIMAEALLNQMAQSHSRSGNAAVRFHAYSAGRTPAPDHQPHPLALRALQDAGIPTAGLQSKNWDHFGHTGAPHMDLVVTLCDQAAGEPCPNWPGQPATAHWSYPDPALPAPGSKEPDIQAFKQVLHALHQRMELFMALPLERLDKLMLETEARRLAA
jgi:protein-tyrosine-phosphatase/DNA-binding transcriptional ArsR family regulator